MVYSLEDRLSDSPFVDRIWRAQSERPGAFRSIAMSGWEMVVTRHRGTVSLTVRGPETKATGLRISEAGTDYFGIRFKIGTLMPHLPASCLVDQDVSLPAASGTSFWMNGSA